MVFSSLLTTFLYMDPFLRLISNLVDHTEAQLIVLIEYSFYKNNARKDN